MEKQERAVSETAPRTFLPLRGTGKRPPPVLANSLLDGSSPPACSMEQLLHSSALQQSVPISRTDASHSSEQQQPLPPFGTASTLIFPSSVGISFQRSDEHHSHLPQLCQHVPISVLAGIRRTFAIAFVIGSQKKNPSPSSP